MYPWNEVYIHGLWLYWQIQSVKVLLHLFTFMSYDMDHKAKI